MMEREQSQTDNQQLPFDPRTLLISLMRKWWILVIGVGISLLLAVAVAMIFGVREYMAETGLLFTAREGDIVGGVYRVPSLRTQINLVKLPENLKEVRDNLNLKMTVQSLGSSIAVSAQNETSLLLIRTTSNDAERAASLANSVRDVFLRNSVTLRTEEASRSIGKMEERLSLISGDLSEADKALEQFNNTNQVVDLDKETQGLLSQFAAIDTLYKEAKIEKSTIDLQLADLDGIMENLKRQISQEESESGELEGLGAAKTRADRLREKIYSDEQSRMNHAKLTELEISLQRAKDGFSEGLISKAELNKAQAAHDSQKAITVDTQQVAQWKEELERLDKAIVPVKGKTDTPSAPILREMLSKSFELQLSKSSLEDKVRQLEEARDKIRESLDNLPGKQKEYVGLRRNIQSLVSEKTELDQKLSAARDLASRDTPDFSIAAIAEPPLYPVKSTRKVIFAATFLVGASGTLFLILALIFANFAILSKAECELRTGLPVLAEIPLHTGKAPLFEKNGVSIFHEEFRRLHLLIRKRFPAPGLVLVVSAPGNACGVSSTAAGLAMAAGRADERVLVIDTHLWQENDVRGDIPVKHGLSMLSGGLESADSPAPGLGDYLSFSSDQLEELEIHTDYYGVTLIQGGGAVVMGDMIGSKRMNELLESLSQKYSLILLDTAAVSASNDSLILANQADAVLLVACAGKTTFSRLRTAASRLTAAEKPLAGVVLNKVHKHYRETV